MKLRFTVPFDSDPNKIKKDLQEDRSGHAGDGPEFEGDFPGHPSNPKGCLEIDDVGMVIRGKFMCKTGHTVHDPQGNLQPGEHRAFAENGMEFARREVRVALPSYGRSRPCVDRRRTQPRSPPRPPKRHKKSLQTLAKTGAEQMPWCDARLTA